MFILTSAALSFPVRNTPRMMEAEPRVLHTHTHTHTHTQKKKILHDNVVEIQQ